VLLIDIVHFHTLHVHAHVLGSFIFDAN